MTVTVTGPRTGNGRRGRGRSDSSEPGTPSAKDIAGQQAYVARSREDRRQAVLDTISILELPLSGLAAAEQRSIGPDDVGAFTLDIVALEAHKAPMADAVCDLGDAYPVLGVVLDKLAKATPFGALFGVVVSLGVQIAENHRLLPAHLRGISPNLVPRDDLVADLREQAEARQNGRQNGGPEAPRYEATEATGRFRRVVTDAPQA